MAALLRGICFFLSTRRGANHGKDESPTTAEDRTKDSICPSLNESLGDYWHRECYAPKGNGVDTPGHLPKVAPR